MIYGYMKKIGLALITCTMLISQTSVMVAAEGKEYISDVILSYGDTDSDAINWLKSNGYEYVDANLNKGAMDSTAKTLSLNKDRSVYLGYKTTTDADDAITDMRLMNMKGTYSVQDYQVLLKNQQSTIQTFVKSFKSTVQEYRKNYQKENKRAVAAHDLLNMFVDDDTGMKMGDLLLNPIKEECTNYDNMSNEEKKKHADMTTILMQGDSQIVLTIEQILASAADTSDTLWIDRLSSAKSYDDMLQDLMDFEGYTQEEATKALAKKYEDVAGSVASLAMDFQEWVKDYKESKVKLTSSQEDLDDYLGKLEDDEKIVWLNKGYQYEYLNSIEFDGATLLDLFMDDYSSEDEDFTALYPIASVLSAGQKASLAFLSGNQFVSMGYTEGADTMSALKNYNVESSSDVISVYNGIDRSIFRDDVALTTNAMRLQTSSKKNYADNWFTGGLSTTSKVLTIITAAMMVGAIGSAAGRYALYANKIRAINYTEYLENIDAVAYKNGSAYILSSDLSASKIEVTKATQLEEEWGGYVSKAAIGLTMASIVFSVITIYESYKDLSNYYNSTYTLIPGWMIDETSDDKTSTYTYYSATKCNRDNGFSTDDNKVLKDYGDINGDLGKQWVALYTTKDRSAGNPITSSFKVQYKNTTIPEDYTALSMFGQDTAENLTNEQNGYTYADKQKGIYMFYYAPAISNATATTITYGVTAVGTGVVVIGVVLFLRKKKKKAQA